MLDRSRTARKALSIDSAADNASLSNRARNVAARIERLCDDIISSFRLEDAEKRVAHVNQITTAISVDAAPVIMWIERRKPDAAPLEKSRFAQMEHDAEKAARMDAPEYAGGVVTERPEGTPMSEGVRLNATLHVFCLLFAHALRGWADDIEAEEAASQLSKPASCKMDAEKLKLCLERIPIGKAGWHSYQTSICDALTEIFSPDLANPQIEVKTESGRARIDIVFQNQAERGFFYDLAFRYNIPCPHVFVECKNQREDPKNVAFWQIKSRFTPVRGQAGFIVCRAIEDRESVMQRCKDEFNKSQSKEVILVLTDSDIVELARCREVGPNKVSAYLMALWRPILFNC